MQKFAKISDNENDIPVFNLLANQIRDAFQKNFYNSAKKYYGNNTATANILPLYFGICPDSLKATIFEKIRQKMLVENHGHIGTGLIGTQFLMRTLTEYGYADLAFQLAATRSYPGWGYMVANGATTIWELWNGNTADPNMNSQNHVMLLGDLLIWYFENCAGIRTDKTEVGFKKIIMQPVLPAGLSFVNATYNSAYGSIKSNWKSKIASFEWEISIPANTTATVAIPANSLDEIFESGKPAGNQKNIKFLKMEKGAAVFEIQSGNYFFVCNKKWKRGIVKETFIFKEAPFPESHASTIAETPAGLIAAWFGGTKEGNKDVCIWTSRLQNNQWSTPVNIADGIINDSVRYPCYNPVFYYAKNGELLLFYKIGPNVAGWKGYMKRSINNGQTWGNREALPDGFLGPVKNKPVWVNNELFCASSTEKNGWKVHFEMTPDYGRTWRKTGDINDGTIMSAIQPSVLFYPNGRLQVLCRSKNTTINESWSTDNGKTWSVMKASGLPNNNSGTDAVTLQDGRQLLVYNHVKPAPGLPNGKGARSPLNVAISKDGITWFAAAVLEDAAIGQYSYPAVIQSNDGLVHITYTWKRERIKHIVIDPKKLETKEIIKELWPGVLVGADKSLED
jgi:alpha-L-rhamnosidase